MRKIVTLALVSAALALLLFAYPSPQAQAAIVPTSTEKQVIDLVNAERTKRGLAPVRFQAYLTRGARAHSRDMANREKLTHTSANGDTVSRRLIRYGYTTSGYSSWSVGENIARATSGSVGATPHGIVAMWMASDAHRANILRAKWRDVGVGVATSDGNRRYFTLDFGRRTR
jgi:uncharacterized protein YkwD